MHAAAIAAASPRLCCCVICHRFPHGRTVLVAVGKAALAMALAAYAHWPSSRRRNGGCVFLVSCVSVLCEGSVFIVTVFFFLG
jgi:glycerate-2-kinase